MGAGGLSGVYHEVRGAHKYKRQYMTREVPQTREQGNRSVGAGEKRNEYGEV